jgi:drug/metabolite transporter (DMT)-like permease
MIKNIISGWSNDTKGMLFGLVGIVGFSLTLPATRVAVKYMDPILVGFGRAIVAGVLALIILLITRQSFPNKLQLRRLAIVALGVIVGFPLLSAWALKFVPSIHGAIIIGIIPLATVVAGTFGGNEKPSLLFWLLSILGAVVIITYALIDKGGSIELADFALLGAVVMAAIGYAEGGRLSKEMGGWKVISWALVLSMPFLMIPVGWVLLNSKLNVPLEGWIGFGYVSIISQFVAFFAWYKGLAMGGIAKVGQVQLLQPFLTIIASAFLIGEDISLLTIVTMMAILVVVAAGKFAAVEKVVPSE